MRLCKAKLCPVKLSPPGQYFMIVLSWNFVLSMIFGPLSGQYYQYNVMLWTNSVLTKGDKSNSKLGHYFMTDCCEILYT